MSPDPAGPVEGPAADPATGDAPGADPLAALAAAAGHGAVPGSLVAVVGVLAERRPGTTPWAEWSWRAMEVLETAPDLAPWTLLREEAGRRLYFAGAAEVELHPTDTDNLKHNLESDSPLIWVVLRPDGRGTDEHPGMALHRVTVDAGEAHLYADVGQDLLEALPLPPRLRAVLGTFVARHHRERAQHKRRRDRADPESMARRGPRDGVGGEGSGA